MIFTKSYRYRFGDIDEAGIAYYPALLHYFHCCFEDWWSDGLGTPYPHVLQVEKLGLPAVRLEVDFYHPIRFGDEPAISLAVLNVGNASVEFGYWMTTDAARGPACRARVTTVAIDMDTMQSQPLPDRWREPFARYRIAAGELPGPQSP